MKDKHLFYQAEYPFFDKWESASVDQRQTYILEQLSSYIQFAKDNSLFYRERLQGFQVNASHPMSGVPVLQSNDLRENLPPSNKNLLSQDDGDYTVFQSGGTTGVPKTSLFTHQEFEQLNNLNARGFYALGLKPQDRVANLWAVGGLYMTFLHINRMLQQYGCTNFPFSNYTPVDFIATVADSFKINTFTGITSVVLNTLRGLHDLGLKDLHVEKIYFGGEHIYQNDRDELAKKFGTQVIAAPGYGSVDTWYLGYQCQVSANGVFHAHDDQVYLEIVDEETGKNCNPGEVGMLYVTAWPRQLTPIIRYRVGDKAKFLKDSCCCGRTTQLFELLGRGDDVLRIGYDSIEYSSIQQIVHRFPELSGNVQMEKKRREGKDQLIIRVESEFDPNEWQAIKQKFEDAILGDRPSLRDFIAKKSIWPIQVEILKPCSLPLNPRTGKLVRVIDSL